jgi:hypothetical protein
MNLRAEGLCLPSALSTASAQRSPDAATDAATDAPTDAAKRFSRCLAHCCALRPLRNSTIKKLRFILLPCDSSFIKPHAVSQFESYFLLDLVGNRHSEIIKLRSVRADAGRNLD